MSSNHLIIPAFPADRQLKSPENWSDFDDYLHSVALLRGLDRYLAGTIKPPQPTTMVTTDANSNNIVMTVPAVELTVATAVSLMAPSTQEWKLQDGALAGAVYQNIVNPKGLRLNYTMSSKEMY